jgi:hypothetical protein
LTHNPVRRWAVRHRNMDELSAVEPNDDEAIEKVECEFSSPVGLKVRRRSRR